MTKTMPSLTARALLLALGLHAAPAHAQLSRTFVSAARGNDAANCDRPTPCRTFQGAHDKTNPDGEITVLDPGGYGAVTITKSISIVNDGIGEAGILVSGGTVGITINGGQATYVNLRGLTVQGIGFDGGTGLLFTSGFSLTITNCVFRNLTGDGIAFIANIGGTSNLSISDTLSADNGGVGIFIGATANVTARVAIDRVTLVNNSLDGMLIDGSAATGKIDVSVTDSVSANNLRHGFLVLGVDNKASTSLMLDRSVVGNNKGTGLHVQFGPAASLRVGLSSITNNGRSWFALGAGALQSFGDNYIAGNGDGDPAPPTVPVR